MATRFGIKDVADITLTKLDSSGSTTGTQFKFDTLKTSTFDVSADETFARGGRGNPKLIGWQYNKEITLTIEDALIDRDSFDLMFGGVNGSVAADHFNDTMQVDGIIYYKNDAGTENSTTFTIPKAQVKVGGSFALSADGDPATISLTITALQKTVNNVKQPLITFQPFN